MQNLLIVSNGPVPAMPGYKIEGSGQRSWGLATGLARHGLKVTVAVRDHYKTSPSTTADGINLVNWSPGKRLAELSNQFDTVIISYSMGKVTAELASKLKPATCLVLDCYVPIYVELSARKSADQKQALANYLVDLSYFNSSLRRGDYFLCANQAQRHLYTGVLSALGVLNPHSYHEERVIELPFGIHDTPLLSQTNPYTALDIPKDDFVLLWFGGLYPWFDISELLGAVYWLRNNDSKISLVIVGGKNPYNQNSEFVSQYEKAVKFCRDKNLMGNGVHFVDWVDYESRVDWYKHADAVVNINSPGRENEYSWRTRLMDYVWGEVPLLTNGGDPLSELLIKREAALRLSNTDLKYLAKLLGELSNNKNQLKTIKANLQSVRKEFDWNQLVKPLIVALEQNPNPYLNEKKFLDDIKSRIQKAKLASGRLGGAALKTKATAGKLLKRKRA